MSQTECDRTVPPAALAWIEVDTHAIQCNVSALKAWLATGSSVMAVVKANAYGHGLVASARAALAGGASHLGVARLEEAQDLRRGGVDADTLVLGAGHPCQADALVEANVAQTVSSLAMAQAMAKAGRQAGRTARVHLKVDTGMGRVGVPPGDVAAVCRRLVGVEGLALEGISTHVPWDGAADLHRVPPQLTAFEQAVDQVRSESPRPCIRHAANSVITLAWRRAHYDMVRVGLLTYGLSPGQLAAPFPLTPALTLRACITQVRSMQPGQTLSYGGTHTLTAPATIAIVPVGYADGYSRRLSNRGQILVDGHRCPIVGAVCMDQTLVDVSGVPGVCEGDGAVLLGKDGRDQITVAELADKTDGIPHEIVSQLSPRLPWVVTGAVADLPAAAANQSIPGN